MARRVVWSLRAVSDKRKILAYWRKRNQSNAYSRKLHLLFKSAVTLIADYPHIGRPTDEANIRIKIVRDYLLIYEVTEVEIHILTIWDSRQDPGLLERML